MASDYLHNSPWKKKSNEDENIPESIRRPEGYVEPKKEESKRDPEREKAEWERTPESVRKPQSYLDMDTFGLRDTIDKNVRFMTDEEIAAERAAEKEKRAALIQPKKEQQKEEVKVDPKQEQHHAESASVSSNAERPSVAQTQSTVTATTKYEIINGQEIRERMRDFISSSKDLNNISPEDRAEIIKRLGDSKTAEEMRNKRFLIGEVNGQSMMHLLSEQESEKFSVLSGKKRDQYAAQLLESESKTLGSLVTDTQIKMIQEQGNREDSREKVQASTSQKTKNDFSYASSPLELLLQMLFKMFGLDFMNKSSQQQNQQNKTTQTTTSRLSTGPIERGRQTIPDEMLRCFRTDIAPDINITDGKKATVTQICVHSGDMLLGKMTEGEKKTNADIAGKYVVEGVINGQQVSKVIDKDTFNRLENMYQGDRAEEFCKLFNLDENKLDFSRIRFGEGTPAVAYKGASRNAIDYWRGLDVKEMPESAKSVLEPNYCLHGIRKDGSKFESPNMTPEMFYRFATMSQKDQQEYLDRWLGPGSSGTYFTNASGKVVDINSELRKTESSAEQHIKEVSNMQVKSDGGKYHMVAIVDGKEESREITELLYGKFNALDDRSRLRLFNKVFGIADGQSVKVADKAIAMETDQDNSVKRSAESGKQAQGQSWKNSDYAALAAMNFEQEEMNKSQQEHRSNGLRI